MSIEKIDGPIGEVTIKGKILTVESREIRNENTIIMFAVTDFTDTIMLKLFARNDEVTIPTAILYLDETAENGYRVGDESSVTFDCVRNKLEGHEGFKHQVLGKNLYAGVTEKYKDSVDTDKYDVVGVTSFGASANPTCNIKEDGGTAFSYSDGTTATLYLVVKEKNA